MKGGGTWAHDTQNHSSASSSTPNLEPSSPRASGASHCGVFTQNAAPLCEVCSDDVSTVYCKNDQAYLCDNCDADIHLSNPLSARHELVPITNCLLEQVALASRAEERDVQTEALVEPSFVPTAIVASTRQGLSDAQTGDGHGGTFLGNLAELPVVELLPVGGHHIPLDLEGLEDIELESEWIEALGSNHRLKEESVLQVAIPAERRDQFDQCKVLNGRVQNLEAITSPSNSGIPISCGYQIPMTTVHIPQCPPTMLPFLPTLPAAVGRHFPLVDPRNHVPTPTGTLDRKARVARYLQKKKRRTWANKIRYHSRKAYAENRPRIKGRFARPDEFEAYQKQQQVSQNKTNPPP
ncbi:hypothetical protein BSKO_11426 [Bryopsis sp. KO-2023]|nr:hypothetical protein BSKO_11426 [Bryopsis sp. KO-2023]